MLTKVSVAGSFPGSGEDFYDHVARRDVEDCEKFSVECIKNLLVKNVAMLVTAGGGFEFVRQMAGGVLQWVFRN